MSDFEAFVLTKGIPFNEVATPLDRLLLRVGVISKPLAILSYFNRALWYSIVFSILFVGTVELLLRLLVGTSFLTSLTPREVFISALLLVCFGPVTASFSSKKFKKHRAVILTFKS